MGFGFDRRIEDESHPAAGHAAQHPKAPELVAVLFTALIDQRIGEAIGGPRNDRLQRSFEVGGGDFADAADVAVPDRIGDVVQDRHRFAASLPFAFAAQQVMLGHHFQNRPDVLRHAAVDQHQAVLDFLSRLRAGLVVAEHMMDRHQPAARDSEFGITRFGRRAADQLDARPNAAGILPAAPAAADPFAKDRASGH